MCVSIRKKSAIRNYSIEISIDVYQLMRQLLLLCDESGKILLHRTKIASLINDEHIQPVVVTATLRVFFSIAFKQK